MRCLIWPSASRATSMNTQLFAWGMNVESNILKISTSDSHLWKLSRYPNSEPIGPNSSERTSLVRGAAGNPGFCRGATKRKGAESHEDCRPYFRALERLGRLHRVRYARRWYQRFH